MIVQTGFWQAKCKEGGELLCRKMSPPLAVGHKTGRHIFNNTHVPV